MRCRGLSIPGNRTDRPAGSDPGTPTQGSFMSSGSLVFFDSWGSPIDLTVNGEGPDLLGPGRASDYQLAP